MFQQVITDPEAMALGEATVASRGRLSAADLNPASIGLPGMVQLSSNVSSDGFRTPWLEPFGADLWIASPYVDVKLGKISAAYQYKHMFLGERMGRDAQNNPTSTFESYDYTHKLAAAVDVKPNLSVGLGINFIYSNLAPGQIVGSQKTREGRAQSYDLGLLYEREFGTADADFRAAFGWSLTDFGSHIAYSDAAQSDPLPTRMRAGVSLIGRSTALILKQPLATAELHLALSKLMIHSELDESGTISHDPPFRSLFTSWQTVDFGNGEKLTLGEQIVRHAGLGVSMLDILHLRIGRHNEHEQNGGRKYTSLGWGLDLYYVRLDHSWIWNMEESHPLKETDFWRLTARIPLEGNDANFWSEIF